MPWVIELRVVSLPATASMMTKKPNSSSESFSPSMSASIRVVTMSSVGFLPRSVGHRHRVHDQFHRRLRGIDVGVLGVRRHRSSRWTSGTACRGPPAEHPAGRRWPATAARTTPARRSRRCPRPPPILAMLWARWASSSSRRPTARGVNPREMILRSRVWCGASMLSMTLRCSSTCSRFISGGQVGMAPFSQLEKTSLRCDTSLTSACLVTIQ